MAKEDLRYGGQTDVPADIAVCPECDALLWAESTEWCTDSGVPTSGGLVLECTAENEILNALVHEGKDLDDHPGHRWWQSDWQPVKDAVANWCEAEAA